MIRQSLAIIIAVGCLTGCGVASVSPFVTEADRVAEPRLIGSWQDSSGRESAIIVAAPANDYRVTYTDGDGKSGEFKGRLGAMGPYRVLDLEPVDPIPDASDVYKSLVLHAHGVVIIDSVGIGLQFRIVRADSLREYLRRSPGVVAHTMIGERVLLTAPSPELRHFFQGFLARPGVLDAPEVWRRRR